MSSYEQVISGVVRVVEAFGAGIMVLGGLGAFLVFASRILRAEQVDVEHGVGQIDSGAGRL